MKASLIAAGVNIIVVSVFAVFYGIFSSASQITGIGLSGILAGLGVIGVGASPTEGPNRALREAISLLLNSIVAIMEEADIINPNIIVKGLPQPLIIITSKELDIEAEPGVGVRGDTTYIAIPLGSTLRSVKKIEEEAETLPGVLEEILTRELGLSRIVEVSYESPLKLRIRLSGLGEEIRSLERSYPLSLLSLLVLIVYYRLTGNNARLTEYKLVGDTVTISIEVK